MFSATRWLLACCCLAALSLAAACGGDDGPRQAEGPLRIKIAIVQSMSGVGEPYGRSAVQGVELAIQAIQAASSDIQIEYAIHDDQSSLETGLEVYRRLVQDGELTAIIGPTFSTIGLEVLQVADDASIPAISPITTGSGISEVGDYVFRIALPEEASLPSLVEHVSGRSRIERAFVVYHSGDLYSRSARDAMLAGLDEVGGEVIGEVDLAANPNLGAVLTSAALAPADAVFLPLLLDQAPPVLRALDAANYAGVLIGGEALASLSLVATAGDALEGMYVASTWHPDVDNDLSRRFVAAIEDEHGETPDYYAAASHAGIYVLVDAVRRAGSTNREAVRDAIAATRDLATVLGSLSIAPSGDAVFQPVFQQFRGGRLVLAE